MWCWCRFSNQRWIVLTATNTSKVLVTDFRDQLQAHSSGLCTSTGE